MQVTIYTDDGCRWLTAEYDSVDDVQTLIVGGADVACVAIARHGQVDEDMTVRFDQGHVVALSALPQPTTELP